MELALQPLTPYVAGGWTFESTPGYYIHRDRLYLQGEITNPRGNSSMLNPAVSTTILTGLPTSLCPAVNTALTVIADLAATDDVATPGVNLPVIYTATITTAGDLVLGSLPNYINTIPPSPPYTHNIGGGPTPDFNAPVLFTLVLGNLSWQLGLGPLPDIWTPVPFAPYLAGSDFTDIDSTIFVHGARVHLGGHVQARVTNPLYLGTALPAQYTNDLGSSESLTTAQAPVGEVAIRILNDGSTQVITDQDGDDGSAGSSWLVPSSSNWDVFAGLTSHFQFGAGSLRRTALAAPSPSVSFNYGSYDCPGPGPFGGPVPCNLVSTIPVLTADINAALADFYPTPDWFVIGFVIGVNTDGVIMGTAGCDPITGGCGPTVIPGDMTISADAACSFVYFDGTTAPTSASPTDTSTNSCYWGPGGAPSLSPWGAGGVLAMKAAAEYPYAPSNSANRLLWRPGEINSFTLSTAGAAHIGQLTMGMTIFPYWLKRRDIIFAGEVLDLTGAGWQALPGLTPGTIESLPGPNGIRHRGRIVGSNG